MKQNLFKTKISRMLKRRWLTSNDHTSKCVECKNNSKPRQPQPGDIVEYIRNFGNEWTYLGYVSEEIFINNKMSISVFCHKGKFASHTIAYKWRWPGETEWRE